MNQFSSDKPQVFIPPAFEDFRGYLSVPYDRDVPFQVCQINQGYSREAFTLRGLHFQMGEHAQAKMVSCLHGSIFNVAVDLRPGKCFGYSYSEVLSFENRKMMYIPKGFAHGYYINSTTLFKNNTRYIIIVVNPDFLNSGSPQRSFFFTG